METKDFQMMHDYTSLNKVINETVPVSVMIDYLHIAKGQLLDIVCNMEKVDAGTMHNLSNVNATFSLLEKWVTAIDCVDECLYDDHPDCIREMIADVENMAKETVTRLRERLEKVTEALNNETK